MSLALPDKGPTIKGSKNPIPMTVMYLRVSSLNFHIKFNNHHSRLLTEKMSQKKFAHLSQNLSIYPRRERKINYKINCPQSPNSSTHINIDHIIQSKCVQIFSLNILNKFGRYINSWSIVLSLKIPANNICPLTIYLC